MRDYKLVVLGAGGVGKSSLTVQFVQGVYLDTYDPTIEDSYRKTIEIDNKVFDLEILDTAGVAQFTAMRELYIKAGMGFLLVYSVTDRDSLRELMELKEQVLRIKDSQRVPMVLVGNKADLVDDRIIPVEEGIGVSSQWGKVPFYETSALLRSNVDEVFVDLVRQIIRNEIETVTNTTNNHPSLSQASLNDPLRKNGGQGNMSSNNDRPHSPFKNTRSNSNATPSSQQSTKKSTLSRTNTNRSNSPGSLKKHQSGSNQDTLRRQIATNSSRNTQQDKKGTAPATAASKKQKPRAHASSPQSSASPAEIKQEKKKKKKNNLCTIL
ncbi:related to Ras-related protein RSR1 [Nakaseomyces glabratus]|nr:Ras family [Nakaseomyces glabratus]QNG13174.1 uncharacterized protein GWK60_E02871 [Nakaseomyces glabratus]SCV17163.1 related to Ras-related protein RSR1 [Nakaseomyces glabratus]SLM16961.1 related to Ras-related protein RSR1 [Nakaseomyces glabratus]